jgi:hypothetical protein
MYCKNLLDPIQAQCLSCLIAPIFPKFLFYILKKCTQKQELLKMFINKIQFPRAFCAHSIDFLACRSFRGRLCLVFDILLFVVVFLL